MIEPPFFPIVYIRGYAGTQSEVEDTVADPYMGFNVGATKLRQRWTGEVQRHVFESPLLRLMKDHGYADVFPEWIEAGADAPPRSVWIFRYYEPVSAALGSDERPEMEAYAARFDAFLRSMREYYCGDDVVTDAKPVRLFTAYLARWAILRKRGRTLGFSIDLRVQVPEYEVERTLWRDRHYEGGCLFRDKLNLELTPDDDTWKLRYGWDRSTPNRASRRVDPATRDGAFEFRIPIEQRTRPGLVATLVLRASDWQ